MLYTQISLCGFIKIGKAWIGAIVPYRSFSLCPVTVFLWNCNRGIDWLDNLRGIFHPKWFYNQNLLFAYQSYSSNPVWMEFVCSKQERFPLTETGVTWNQLKLTWCLPISEQCWAAQQSLCSVFNPRRIKRSSFPCWAEG